MSEATLLRSAKPRRPYTTVATTPLQAARRVAHLCSDTFAFLGKPGSKYAMEQPIVHDPRKDPEWGFDNYLRKGDVAIYWEGGPYDSFFELTGWQDVYELLNIDPDKVFIESITSFVLGFHKAV